jgi:MoxR-like ATPase
MSHQEIELLGQKINEESLFLNKIANETSKIIVGQRDVVEKLLIGLLCNSHILLEGLPGLAKTLAIKTLAQTVGAQFQRIQFTPDLLPADVTGTMIYNPAKSDFTVRKGPVFSNFVLADEINRAPAKVQSALLEAMQERQITIGNDTFPLEKLFLVLATQNPIEQEGTYPLPEAQTDRFLFKIKVGYPSKEDEREIIRRNLAGINEIAIAQVATIEDVLKAQKTVRAVYMDEKIETYILNLVAATRPSDPKAIKDLAHLIEYGASPRASISLAHAAKAQAFLNRRAYVIPDDVRAVCYEVLRHRIGMNYEAEAENINSDNAIQMILSKVEVP